MVKILNSVVTFKTVITLLALIWLFILVNKVWTQFRNVRIWYTPSILFICMKENTLFRIVLLAYHTLRSFEFHQVKVFNIRYNHVSYLMNFLRIHVRWRQHLLLLHILIRFSKFKSNHFGEYTVVISKNISCAFWRLFEKL